MLLAVDPMARIQVALELVAVTLAQQRIAADINDRVQAAMDTNQREYHLREQLKAIRAQLGDAAGSDADADEFARRIEASGMNEEAQKEALREVGRLRRVQMESAEYTVIRTWLETVCDIPWTTLSTDTPDLARASQVLDRDHHGLEKVKERLLEYLAVRKLAPESRGPILCLVGPPGVGKTSLGRSVAEALGRSYARVALGGIKDETEVRGHRRTYVGALPGRIARALIRAKSRNPVIVLDEIDKVGTDFRGDPASALLEVLDPEQNRAYVDHYVDLPIDLSQVLFIATANLVDPIPHALYDRLEILEIPGYTEEDKLKIARRFLLPKLAADHGLKKGHLTITEAALRRLIRDYTREAGLRDLERQLATLHRKVARGLVEGKKTKVRITDKSVANHLGPIRYHQELVERVDQPGVVIGLAWTATGGDQFLLTLDHRLFHCQLLFRLLLLHLLLVLRFLLLRDLSIANRLGNFLWWIDASDQGLNDLDALRLAGLFQFALKIFLELRAGVAGDELLARMVAAPQAAKRSRVGQNHLVDDLFADLRVQSFVV